MTDQRHHQILSDLNPQYTALQERIPKVYKGFAHTMTKELIALAIGEVHGCDGCIASHARTCGGVGRREQAAGRRGDRVTLPMHGGPVTIDDARAYTAFCESLDAENV